MKIGIDARFLTHPQPGGFKTYTENLISALSDIDTENEYVLYVDRIPGTQNKIPARPNLQTRVVKGSFPLVGLPWREQIGIRWQVVKDQVDVFHAPCLTAPLFLDCPLVITVHDMIWAFPEKFSQNDSLTIKRKLMEWYNYAVPKSAIKRAAAIITVSEAAKADILDYSGLNADRIFVTHEAASPSFKQIKDSRRLEAVQHQYKLSPDFILAIGSADPRKNISSLVQAYSLLTPELRKKHRLAIVWTHSFLAHDLSNMIQKLDLVEHVRFLQQVSTDDLVLLYNAASLFVFPSRYEGFGLPLLEAMACGVPVIASNNSSIPEIVGDAALQFSATNVDQLAELISTVLTSPELQQDMKRRGIERASTFSWRRCGMETIEVYSRVIGNR